MNPTISQFLLSQSCANIACLDLAGKPYSFSCYYVFHPELHQLYFKSSADAAHAGFLASSSSVSGTVLPDKLNKLMVKVFKWKAIAWEKTTHWLKAHHNTITKKIQWHWPCQEKYGPFSYNT